MMQIFRALTLCLGCVMLAGCGVSDLLQTPTPRPEPTATVAPTATLEPTPTFAHVSLNVLDPFAPGDPPHSGQFSVEIAGTESDGTPVDISVHFRQANSPDDGTIMLEFTLSGYPEADNGTHNVTRIGETTYYVFEESCIELPEDEARRVPIRMFFIDAYLADDILATGKLVESGVLTNGILTDHYRLTLEDLQSSDLIDASGLIRYESDMWVSVDRSRNILVKLDHITNGQLSEDTGGLTFNIDGRVEMHYELTSLDQPVEIALPPEC